MIGWVAPTDFDWYSFLAGQDSFEEVNFWRPSAARQSKADLYSPFFFKLKAPHNAICGFGFFAGYSALPIWLAWEAFGTANGRQNRAIMNSRIEEIRRRIGYHGSGPSDQIGCILIVNPTFFSKHEWIPQPRDWPPANLIAMRYDLENGEGQRIWLACLERAFHRNPAIVASDSRRFGTPSLIRPRLGQGTFRIYVTDAYARACAVTHEHSRPNRHTPSFELNLNSLHVGKF